MGKQQVVGYRLWLSVALALLLPWQPLQQQRHFEVYDDAAAAARRGAGGGGKGGGTRRGASDSSSRSFGNSSPFVFSSSGGRASLMGLLMFAEAGESLYSILGVSRTATNAEIKKAFRDLSKKYHPDKNKDPAAETHFKKLTRAYEVLTNAEKRKIYDSQGSEGIDWFESQQGSGSEHGFGDIFGDFFGFSGQRETPQVPASTVHLKVSLEQLYNGDTLHVSFTRPVLCDKADDCYTRKADCKGPGIRVITQQMGPGFIVQNQIQDDSCVEQGKAWKSQCKSCPKGMTQKETIELSALVERGMKAGDQILFEGVGEQRLGHEPGDLVIVIAELPHKRYTRSGDDLEMTMHISLMEALVGFEQKIIHLDSTPVTIKRTDVTYDGQVVVYPGKGMPRRKNPSQFGSLRVRFGVMYPVALDDKQKALAKQALEGVDYIHIAS